MVPLITALLFACLAQTNVQVQQRETHEKGSHYRIDIQYPEIENGDSFNAAVRQSLDSVIAGFKKAPTVSVPGVPADGYLKGSYKADVLKDGMVSVLLSYEEYTPGSAHPWGTIASVNYDSRSCRVLALSDLFRPGANYLSRLSELAIASLDQKQFADRAMIRHGAAQVESNFKVFTLTDISLVLHFPTYQVAPGVAGPQTVIVPLDTLAPLLKKR